MATATAGAAPSSLHSSFDSLEARMAAFKARSKAPAQPAAAATVTAEEKQQTAAAAAAADPYDAFITPISAANVVPASSPILASATPTAVPPRLSRANSRTHVPVQAEAAPGGDAAAPAAPPPGHRSQRSVTLSNISVEGWGQEAEEESAQLHQRAAVTQSSSAAPSASPPSALVLAYKSDGEGGPLSARGSRSARGSKTKGTEHMQSWAEVEAMQKARAAEKAMLTARRKRQEQREAGMGEDDDAATASFGSPVSGQRTARSAASPLSPGSGQLTARSRGGANGLDSARGGIVPASGSAVLSALAQYERKKQMGLTSPPSARGTPNGSLTSRATARDSPMSPAGVRGDFRDRRPLDPSAFDRDDHDQRAYSSSTFVPNTARAGAGGASPFSSPAAAAAAEQRRRDIQQRKERVRQRKAAALAAVTLASTPVEQGGTLTARPGSSAQQQRREGQPQATSGAPVGRTCELDFKDQNCVVM